jgi:hypothetical protein
VRVALDAAASLRGMPTPAAAGLKAAAMPDFFAKPAAGVPICRIRRFSVTERPKANIFVLIEYLCRQCCTAA